jgi:hypothetical protein
MLEFLDSQVEWRAPESLPWEAPSAATTGSASSSQSSPIRSPNSAERSSSISRQGIESSSSCVRSAGSSGYGVVAPESLPWSFAARCGSISTRATGLSCCCACSAGPGQRYRVRGPRDPCMDGSGRQDRRPRGNLRHRGRAARMTTSAEPAGRFPLPFSQTSTSRTVRGRTGADGPEPNNCSRAMGRRLRTNPDGAGREITAGWIPGPDRLTRSQDAVVTSCVVLWC